MLLFRESVRSGRLLRFSFLDENAGAGAAANTGVGSVGGTGIGSVGGTGVGAALVSMSLLIMSHVCVCVCMFAFISVSISFVDMMMVSRPLSSM